MTDISAPPGPPTGTHYQTVGTVRGSWLVTAFAGLLGGAVLVAILSFALPPDSIAANVLLDRQGRFPYPATLQNVMWLMFGLGIAEVTARLVAASGQMRQIRAGLLPEDDTTMLRAEDLGRILRQSPQIQAGRTRYYLNGLIVRVILQFQAGRSVAQANDIMNSSLELHQHALGLRYSLLRYLTWFIPTLGFIGTVVGIAFALDRAGSPPDVANPGELEPWMAALTGDLSVAFNTTLVALILSAILVFLMHIAESREEGALNSAGQYCLDNLINRLYER